jgi:RNA 3'-terminal phosphate cyclase
MKQKEQQQHVPLRVQLILSLLSGKPIKLKNIRSDSDEPGLTGKIFEKNRKFFQK